MRSVRMILCSVMAVFALCFFTSQPGAQEKATKEECIAKCEAAAKRIKEIGMESALKEFMDKKGPFQWKDSYVFCIGEENGKMLAHPIPRFLNFPMKNYMDADGEKPFVDVLQAARETGKGFKTYTYITPGEGIAARKTIFFLKVPETKAIVCAGYYETPRLQKEVSEIEKIHEVRKADLFSDIGGYLHGITFDGGGNMFVAVNGKDILRIKPDGELSDFCFIKESKGFGTQGNGGVFVFDLAYGPDNYIYAAAENRILKISPDGAVSSIIREDFSGRWGVCGITFHKNGTMYAAYGNKVCRYTPAYEKSIFIDGDNENTGLVSAMGLKFDSDFKHLYICDAYGGKVVKVPMKSDGTPGSFSIVYQTEFYRPEYIALDGADNLFVSNHGSGIIIKIGNDGQQKAIKYENLRGNQTLAMAGKGFEDNFLYITSGRSGEVFKVNGN